MFLLRIGEILEEWTHKKSVEDLAHTMSLHVDNVWLRREDQDILDIDAMIVCERDSHKPIIIGKGGRTIKEIGTQARHELEHFFRIKVNLKLFVKVKANWRDSEYLVRNFGYDQKTLDG